MNEPVPARLAALWSPEARADLRAIDCETAMQILRCLDRYLTNRTGDVKKLKPPFTGFRLRCGDYLSEPPPSAIARNLTAKSDARGVAHLSQGGIMIARIWHGWTKAEDADGYEAHLKPELLPGLSKVAGFQGSYLLRRAVGDEVEFITMILWDSVEAIRAVAGADYEQAVIPEERRRYLKRFDAKAAHFEVMSEQKPSR